MTSLEGYSRKSILVGLFLIGGLFWATDNAAAYCIYNDSSEEILVRTVDGGDELHVPTIAPADNACRNFETNLHLPREKPISVFASSFSFFHPSGVLIRRDWICIVGMQAGGYTVINERSRDSLDPDMPADRHCESYSWDDLPTDNSLPTGFDTLSGTSLAPRDREVRFLASADPQYWTPNDPNPVKKLRADTMNSSADSVMASMVNIVKNRDSPLARGIILAGDLTNTAGHDDVELKRYKKAVGDFRDFFFDGLGNHDIDCNGFFCIDTVKDLRLAFIKRNTVLTNRSSERRLLQLFFPSVHYSWDWHDVHFVQLNLFPGNGDGGQRNGHDPRFSLDFLIADLATYVGTSGRPVILIHHYGFDRLSTSPSPNPPEPPWWTAAQRTAYLNALSSYNVIAMFTGHIHLQKAHPRPSWELMVSGCGINDHGNVVNDGAGTCTDFVAAAARGTLDDGEGVFLDVLINNCNEMIVTRKDKHGSAILDQEVTVEFTAPGGQEHPSCNTPPVADAGGPYSADEGGSVILSGAGSSDPDQSAATLSYAWDLDGNGSFETPGISPSFSAALLDGPTSRTVRLRVTDDGSLSDIDEATVTVENVAPVVTAIGAVIDENGVAMVNGTITDPAIADTFEVLIDWGEGAPVSSFYPAGTTMFSEIHQYLDDNPSGTASDIYPIGVRVTDDDGGVGLASTMATVNNVAPTASIDSIADEKGNLIGQDVDIALVGLQLDMGASFADVGALDTHTVAFDWDDGTVNLEPAATSPVADAHTYSSTGIYTVLVTVTDDDTGAVTVSDTIEVVDSAGAVADAIEDLTAFVNDPNQDPAAVALVQDAVDELNGNGGGNAANGALDMLGKGDWNAALVKLSKAIELLEEADPATDVDLSITVSQLVLSAKSALVHLLGIAKANATKPNELRRIAEAEALIAEGDQLCADGDLLAAVEAYRTALTKLPKG